jgi:hypothetical protein
MQGIEIPIGAPLGKLNQDVDGAKKILKGFAVAANGDLLSIGKSLGTLERQLKVFKEGIKNSTDPSRILLLNNAIKATEAQIAGTKNAINGVGFNKFSAGSNQAAFALTNLGRVAQDAPFGFIGIQNNLNPLLESFQRLRSENTSLGATFKALGSSLIGPAGLGIALSLVTAAFTFYTIYAQKAKKETKELASATDSLTDSAAQEIAKVTLLYDASQNLNIPLKQRQKIVDELQKQFPQTFGNLSDEAILAGKAKTAYEGLTQAIINSAVVRGGEDLIASKVKILAASLIAFQDQQRKLSDATKGKGFLSKSNSFNVDENGDLETLNDYETRIKKEILDVRKSVQGAIGNFSAESIIGNVGGDPLKKEKTDKFKRDPQFTAKSSINELDLFLEKFRETEAQLNKTPLTPFPGLKEKLAVVNQSLIEFNASANDIIQNSIINTFNNLGTAIGESLATGGNVLKAVGNTILQGLAGFLSEMGSLLIKYGTLAVIKGKLDLAILAGGPIAIGAGLAAIAVGIGLKAAGSAIGSLAKGGGGSSGAGSVPVPQGSSTISTSAAGSAQDFGGGRVVFEISGTNLIGVLNRAGAKLQRFGP